MIIKYGVRAIILGMLISFCSLHYDRWIANRIGPWVRTAFQRMGTCTMQVGHTSCTFLSPSVTFHDVTVQSSQGHAWHWSAKRYTIEFSWLHFVFYGTIDMQITLEGLRAHSGMDKATPAIVEHITGLLSGESYLIPTFITAFTLNDAQLTVIDERTHFQGSIAWDSTLKHRGNSVQILMHLRDGSSTYNALPLIQGMNGSLQVRLPASGALQDLCITGECSVQSPSLSYPLKMKGNCGDGQGSFHLGADNQPTRIDVTAIRQENDAWTAHIDGCIAWQDFQATIGTLLTGKDDVLFEGTLSTDGTNHTTSVTAHCATLVLAGQHVHNAICCAHLAVQDGSVNVSGTLSTTSHGAVQGTACWNTTDRKGTASCTNQTAYTLPLAHGWCVQPQACNLKAICDDSTLDVQVACTATNASTAEQQSLTGTIKLQQGDWTALLSNVHGTLECIGTYVPTFSIKRFIMKDIYNKPILRALTRHNRADIVHALIDVPFLRSVCKKLWGYDIHGEGVLSLDLKLGQQSAMRIRLSESNVRLPSAYNFIRDACALCVYDSAQRVFTIKQGVYHLDRGIVRTDGAQCVFGAHGQIESLYVPLVAQQCMVTFDRGVFALLSGYTHVRKDDGPFHIGGHVLIDQAHFEGNIFSHMFQRTVATSARDFLLSEYTDACLCDITCESLHPISIKTAFFETRAHTMLSITGPLSSPSITGNVTLAGGAFFFPYKPLYITRGAIYFDEQRPQDSLVEVTASNKIKKYDVTMTISGSLLNNSVQLASFPSLSEEQILSLLLIGSQEESLNMVMPALIMQNLSSLIFNQVQSPTELEQFFGRLLKPFEYIRFVPSFADQTGRGGLRGTLEIEITDRLRAMIQKNFSLLEDTRFEVEYAVSDDITIRGMRNERRDVGGEIEVRWKF